MKGGAGAAARLLLVFAALFAPYARAQVPQVDDIPTRPGVTTRVLTIAPAAPRAAVILFAGGHGGLQIQGDGSMLWGEGNFLVRNRARFAGEGLFVVVVDAPSDRGAPRFLSGFRQTPGHVDDVRAVIAWTRARAKVPVWLVGTSRGTQSAAHVATQLTADGERPDGVVLSSTILVDFRGRSVPDMPLERMRVPVLVVHHEDDGCRLCLFSDMPLLMTRLRSVPNHELVSFKGGADAGDPCEPRAHHGYAGIHGQVVQRIAAWIHAAR